MSNSEAICAICTLLIGSLILIGITLGPNHNSFKEQSLKEKQASKLCFLYGYPREGRVLAVDTGKDTLVVQCEGDRF